MKSNDIEIQIQPLWVETYLTTPSLNEKDGFSCCDGDIAQTLHNVLHVKNDGAYKSRFDIAFGEEGVCLSILIKYYSINDDDDDSRYHQYALFKKFRDEGKSFKPYGYSVSYQPSKNSYKNKEISHTKRIGIRNGADDFDFASYYKDYEECFPCYKAKSTKKK